jgi:hypothetical protein
MANQVGPGTYRDDGPQSGQFAGPDPASAPATAAAPGEPVAAGAPDTSHIHPSFHGRAVSWVAVTFIVAGFLVGGLCLVFGPIWPGFWAGAGLVVVGGLLALATDIFEDWY